jgi:type IV pilus assembly protein PilB
MEVMTHRTGGRFSDVLVRRGLLDASALDSATAQAAESGERIEKYLVQIGLVDSASMSLTLAEYLGMPAVSLARFTPPADVVTLISPQYLSRLQVFPLFRSGTRLFLAMADPFDLSGIETVQGLTGLDIVPLVAQEKEVADLLERHGRAPTQGMEEILRDVTREEGEAGLEVELESAKDVSLDEIRESADEAPVIRIVNTMMIEALRKRASDIHIEPLEKSLRLRYRMDGVLYENPSPPKRLHPAIVSRIKILSNLNIAERRVPQDGRFKIKALGREADVRVSILPTVHGEKIVMRILDKASLAPGLQSLGLDPKPLEDFTFAIQQPHGMILVTGPTGSGKTTTLYSCLQDLNQIGVNIITVEDPVEYQLVGISQVQTHSEIGLTFATGLRSILRQDPDIVMVGEIRDSETAMIAVQAALTGHLVLSTLHTNDAAGAVARMVNMGIEPFLLSSSLLMTQAQRLYRKLCVSCRRPVKMPLEMLRLNRLNPADFEGAIFHEAVGCPKCNHLGYKGRGALMEVLRISDALRIQMLKDANATRIREIGVAHGMATLREVGLQKVRDGITTLEEVLRVTSGE